VEARLDFEAVQRRWQLRSQARELAETEPAHLIAFDVLELRGESQLDKPLTVRRSTLQRLFLDVLATSPLALGMQTDDYDTVVGWLRDLPAVGIEGAVAKPASSRYLPGQRGWQKVKAFATTEAIVGGVTGSLERPIDLVLGRYDSQTGELRVVGRSSAIGLSVGIDLGTTYSAVARVDGHGRPQVLTNRDGENITLSVVLFDGEQPIVGTMAKRSIDAAPLDVVQFVKTCHG
jgi:hypothetical protein